MVSGGRAPTPGGRGLPECPPTLGFRVFPAGADAAVPGSARRRRGGGAAAAGARGGPGAAGPGRAGPRRCGPPAQSLGPADAAGGGRTEHAGGPCARTRHAGGRGRAALPDAVCGSAPARGRSRAASSHLVGGLGSARRGGLCALPEPIWKLRRPLHARPQVLRGLPWTTRG